MESLSPFLWRTYTSYNMPVYPGARRIVGNPSKPAKTGAASIVRTSTQSSTWASRPNRLSRQPLFRLAQ